MEKGLKKHFPPSLFEAEKVQSDHLLLQAEVQKLEEDASNERASLEDSLSALENQLTDKR